MEESSFLVPQKTLQASQVEEGMHVADFGAGSGHFTLAAAKLVGHTGEVWAIDMNPDLLTRLKNHALQDQLKNVEVMRGDLELPNGSNLPADRFDVVIAANLLFWLEKKESLIAEMRRVLKKGGRALVIDWKDSFGGLGPHPDHVVTAGRARDLFGKDGFSYMSDVPAGKYHWSFLVRKN